MLARFEQLMEQAVEGSLRRVFPTTLQPVQLAKAAARAMERAQIVGVHGPEAPNRYELRLAPADLERFGDYTPAVIEQITSYLVDYASDRGLRLVAPPHVDLMADTQQRAGGVRADARFAGLAPAQQQEVEDAMEGTRRLRLAELSAARDERTRSTEGALWLVSGDGSRFPLEPRAGIVRLGRATDNDVVLANPRISRYHAQLRWIEPSWLLYDLESTNGSWVDEEPVTAARPRALAPDSKLRLGDQELHVTTERSRRGGD